MVSRIGRLAATLAAAFVGLVLGFMVGASGNLLPQPADYPFLAEHVPLPHHVPKVRGGLSFRFVMAHDVLHERFAKHGPAHYRERNRLTRARLEKLVPDDPASFALADDLAAGLGRLGKPDEAVAVLRDKLARQ